IRDRNVTGVQTCALPIFSQVLGVSRSGYYRWRGRGPSDRALENKRLKDRIKEIWEDSYKTYGSPRIHEQLKKEGETASRPRVAQIGRASCRERGEEWVAR